MPSIVRRTTSFFNLKKSTPKFEARLEKSLAQSTPDLLHLSSPKRASIESLDGFYDNIGHHRTGLFHLNHWNQKEWREWNKGDREWESPNKVKRTRIPKVSSCEHLADRGELKVVNPDPTPWPERQSSLNWYKNYSTESLSDPLSGMSTPGLSTSSSTISSAFTSPMSSTPNLQLTLSHFEKPKHQFLLPESLQCESPTAEIFPLYDLKRLSDIPEGKIYQPRIATF